MPLAVYTDECVNTALPPGLRDRGYQATSASAEGMTGVDDSQQLEHATARGWVILSHNVRHFQRLHRAFADQNRWHCGILLIPETGPITRLILRAALMLDWMEQQGVEMQIAKWGDLQLRLTQGYRPPGYTETEIRHALGHG
jgi:hypothetical protein